MKLAVSSYSLSRWRRENNKSLEQMLAWMADNGVQAVEFSGLDEKAADRPVARAAALRRRCEKLGMKVAAYCVGAELLTPRAQQKQTIDRLKVDVDVAAEFGVRTMRHDVTRGFDAYKGFRKPKTFANALKVVVPALRQVADYAAGKGVITSLENHGFYMQASKRVEQLIKTVNHPNYALTVDMGNFLCVNEDPVAAVRRVAKYAVMAHTKDFHVRPKKQMPPSGWFATPTSIALRGAICGHGAIDVPTQLRILKKAGYNHYLSLEFEGMEPQTMGVKLGLEYLRQQLKAIKT